MKNTIDEQTENLEKSLSEIDWSIPKTQKDLELIARAYTEIINHYKYKAQAAINLNNILTKR